MVSIALTTLADDSSSALIDAPALSALANPAPVAQTFFVDDAILARYQLDGIVTVVDALHGPTQLDEHHEAQEQVGFADRLLVSKADLID